MKAQWITVTEPANKTAFYIFTKSFTLTKSAVSFKAKISADTRYKLYINGIEAAQGPCMGGAFYKYYEELELSKLLTVGENMITVKVLFTKNEKHLTTMFRNNMPALFFDSEIETDDGEIIPVVSDESFGAAMDTSVSFHICREIMDSILFEESSANTTLVPLAVSVLYTPNSENHYYTPWGCGDKYIMKKRPIPNLEKGERKELTPLRNFIGENGKYNLILAAEKYTTDMLDFEYLAKEGCKIRIIYAECALTRADDGSLYKGIRDNTDGVISSTAFDILTASGKPQAYELFYYRAFRYIRVEFDEKPEYFRAYGSRYTFDYEKHAKDDGVGSFGSSEPLHSRIWDISKNTLECCSHEILVDCPFYEQQQYVMDGGLESLYGWRFSNDGSLQKKLITDMAQSQNADGLISANYPNTTAQIIPGFSLYFIMAVREYLRYTGDTALACSMIGVAERILGYFAGTADKSGIVMPNYGWNYLDWVNGWTYGVPNKGYEAPMTAYNLMYVAALNAAAEICEHCERKGLASDYRERAEITVKAVNSRCFDRERGLYTDVPDAKEYSQHTTLWAILSGAVTGDEAHELMARTMEAEDASKCSFSMRYYLLRALERSGCYEKYADSVLLGWKLMLDNHCTTWCEDAVTCRSECHAWSCTPVFEMSAMILGVQPIENGFRRVSVKPHTLGLTFAKGRVPIPNGYIDVEWHNENGSFTLDIKASRTLNMEIVLPGGRSMSVKTNEISVTE